MIFIRVLRLLIYEAPLLGRFRTKYKFYPRVSLLRAYCCFELTLGKKALGTWFLLARVSKVLRVESLSRHECRRQACGESSKTIANTLSLCIVSCLSRANRSLCVFCVRVFFFCPIRRSPLILLQVIRFDEGATVPDEMMQIPDYCFEDKE